MNYHLLSFQYYFYYFLQEEQGIHLGNDITDVTDDGSTTILYRPKVENKYINIRVIVKSKYLIDGVNLYIDYTEEKAFDIELELKREDEDDRKCEIWVARWEQKDYEDLKG